ncbi:hypothetical protein BN946_scf184803.g33 [Trametes cinnabarina]|uniref:protein-tyrosine-phosphatase n=1 Tax=Pycnoporus cinnabarinus TaxID=5643 RepID=A0A060S680_PYCCI|nr:hypothetical protein BN946_scf184803.g33 [Trametes cinnabarina]
MGPSTAAAQSPISLPPPISASNSLPLASSSGVASSATLPPSAFTALPPSSLKAVLSDPSALILDIRPHNSYVQARIRNALSLAVPSTLLKRPLFSLSRLADMLPTSSAREKFSKWPEATRILVYDADSATIPQHTLNSNLLGLMRKFRSEGYPADKEVAWLRGGFHAVWRDYPDYVDQEPPPEEAEDDETTSEAIAESTPGLAAKSASAPNAHHALRAKQLPMAAFTSATTLPLRPRPMQPPSTLPMRLVPPTPSMPRNDPLAVVPPTPGVDGLGSLSGPLSVRRGMSLQLPPGAARSKTAGAPAPGAPLYSMPTLSPHYTQPGLYTRASSFSVPGRQVACNPFFDTIRQNLELGSRDPNDAAGEGIPLKLPRRIARKSRRATESSSATDSSDESSRSDGEVHEPKATEVGVSSHTKTHSLAQPLRISSMARRSPAKSRSSSPAEPNSTRALSRLDESSPSSNRSSPAPSSQSQTPPDADDLTRALEDQFYNIELGEQKRLLGVMERHSMESGRVIQEGSGFRGVTGTTSVGKSTEGKPVVGAIMSDVDPKTAAVVGEEAISSFPYSITAGLEKGAKNRYRNIWPFEHARVRLRKTKPDDDDYMNASYVQPLGTTKRYIATQGPLPATYTDFWTLCWEQNVHVIVMLTREIEGSSVKCGKYWEDGQYGPLRLRLLETNDTPEFERKRRESETNGGFFSSHIPQPKPKQKTKKRKGNRGAGDVQMQDKETPSTIKRVFELTNSAYPLAPPRIVTQFQYLDWPDLNVPEDPRGVLDLIRQVEDTVEQSRSSSEKQWGEGPLYRRTRPKKPSPERSTTQRGSTVVMDKSQAVDQVDPITGVALLAKENAPVLLHCSAGVGRTGGFIAVDAVLDGVRREMRKRKEGKTKETATAEAASTFGQGRSNNGTQSPRRSHSRSPGNRSASASVSTAPEPMDVDHSAIASPDLHKRDNPALTVPVEAGSREVHVPVAGFTDAVPMDVDERAAPSPAPQPDRPTSIPASKRTDVAVHLLQATPELVNEVRRAALRGWSSTVETSTPAHARRHESSDATDSSSRETMSSAMSEVSSVSFAGGSSLQSGYGERLSSSPPTSYADSSTNSMVGKTARLSMASPSPPAEEMPQPAGEIAARMRTVSTSSTVSRKAGKAEHEGYGAHRSLSPPSMASQSHRLNSWRSEVHTSDMSRKTEDTVSTPSGKPSTKTSSSGSTKAPPSEATVRTGPPSPDLKEPRKLHDDSSPPLLSTYDEPIRRVIEDMREQRMSLCQSLRQYVFVHRAIIEGALMIVDEEKRREKEEGEGAADMGTNASKAQLESGPLSAARRPSVPPLAPMAKNTAQDGVQHGPALGSSTLGSPFQPSDGEREVGRKRSVPEFVSTNTIIEGVVSPPSDASPGRHKRVASPMELTKEDVLDGILLTKRPSVKRRQRPSDVSGPRPQFDSATGAFALHTDAPALI